MMDNLITAIGFGQLGYDALHHLLNVSKVNMDLICYDAELKSFEKLHASSVVQDDCTFNVDPAEEPFTKDLFLYLLDTEEGLNLLPIIAHSTKLRGQGTFTIVTLATPMEVPYSEDSQLKAVLHDLSKEVVDAVIVLSSKTNSITPAEAVAAIIKFLVSFTTEKRPDTTSLDLMDLKYILQETGIALAGISEESGTDRAECLVRNATALPFVSPHLWNFSNKLLMSVISGAEPELEMDELDVIIESVQESLGLKDEVLFGYELDDTFGENVRLQLLMPVNFQSLK